MTDQELHALRRRLEAEPGDEALATQYTRALLRAGQDAELRRHLAAGLACSKRWEEHADDPRSTFVRYCEACRAGVTRVSSVNELARHVVAGQRVGGYPEVLERYLDGVIAGLRADERLPLPPCFSATDLPAPTPADYPGCECLREGSPQRFHCDVQDTDCDAWKHLLELVERAARDRVARFEPRADLTAEEWSQIVTLPASIGTLTHVESLALYGSHLARIPPEIGRMSSLIRFDPYTSYRLHWFPYEITRSLSLRDSTVSTRALYGNYKFRPGFPDLRRERGPTSGKCSVCDQPAPRVIQRWITLWVGTDNLPLLVNACSGACLQRLPTPREGYDPACHLGGSVRPDGSIDSLS